MPAIRTYATPEAFRTALEERLRRATLIERINDALHLTFERRGTHDLPAVLVAPPTEWQIPFQSLAEECGLPADIGVVFAGVQGYLEEVLSVRAGQ